MWQQTVSVRGWPPHVCLLSCVCNNYTATRISQAAACRSAGCLRPVPAAEQQPCMYGSTNLKP